MLNLVCVCTFLTTGFLSEALPAPAACHWRVGSVSSFAGFASAFALCLFNSAGGLSSAWLLDRLTLNVGFVPFCHLHFFPNGSLYQLKRCEAFPAAPLISASCCRASAPVWKQYLIQGNCLFKTQRLGLQGDCYFLDNRKQGCFIVCLCAC